MMLVDISIFMAATLVAATIAGLAGFAFGLIAVALWLHALTPRQTITLIAVFGLVVQGYSVWQLRHALRWDRLWPFLLGGVVGVPIGVEVLRWADPNGIRRGVGFLLVAFCIYSVARPRMAASEIGGRAADAGVGLLSGVLGGATGLGGILPTVWCNVRGWPKDEQRAVFQPVAVAIFVASLGWLGSAGAMSSETVTLMLAGLPALLVGMWLGLRLYGRLNDLAFRKVVLALLFVSGLALLR
jgi:uncharacterized membrane protein YfcA